MKRGIATKIYLFAVVLIIIANVFLGWFFVRHETNAITKELNERASAITRSLAYNCEYGMLVRDNDELNRLLIGAAKEKDIAFAQIEDKEGNVIARLEEKENRNQQEKIKEFTAPIKTTSAAKEEVIGGVTVGVSLGYLQEKIAEIKKWFPLL